MSKYIKRQANNEYLNIEGQLIRKHDFLNDIGYKVDGIIRISKDDFVFLPKKRGAVFVHFNLQHSGHLSEKIYLIMKILKNGYYISYSEELLPVLSLQGSIITRCVGVRENLSYQEVSNEDLRLSFIKLNSVKDLKELIYKRYSKSLPLLSKKDILQLGVSISKLKIIDIL